MLKKHFFLKEHHKLALLFFFVIISLIPLFVWLSDQPSRTILGAYYPENCPTLKVPRNHICASQWIVTKNAGGCRTFTCK